MLRTIYIFLIFSFFLAVSAKAGEEKDIMLVEVEAFEVPDTISSEFRAMLPEMKIHSKPSIYELPYSLTLNVPDWKRLWINTGVLASAYLGTLAVLECLPEGATNWNRADIMYAGPFRRWYDNVIKAGPEWDGDNAIFNYVLHPYAGAVYFMAARSNGFNFYRSLLYSALVSTVGWEFGIEGCMERPSIQDIFVTPLVGSVLGECFYKLKRHIVSNGYRLFGSPVLGNIVAFIVDPVNEVVGLFGGNKARRYASSLMPTIGKGTFALGFTCTF